jgi:hypothetical protein
VDRPSVAELLPKIRPAQVLLVRREGLAGWLIRRVTRSEYSHVALLDRTASGIVVTVEAADFDGVKALRLESYLEDERVTGLQIRDRATLTDDERSAIMRAAWLQVGSRYDALQLVGIYARWRLPWLFGGRRRALSQNRLDARDRKICSELVTIAYHAGAGVCLAPDGVALGHVVPGHLADSPELTDQVWAWPA